MVDVGSGGGGGGGGGIAPVHKVLVCFATPVVMRTRVVAAFL